MWNELKCQCKNTFVAVEVPQESDDDGWGMTEFRKQVSAPSSLGSAAGLAADSASNSAANSATGSAYGSVPASPVLPGNRPSNAVAGDCSNNDEGVWKDHVTDNDQKGTGPQCPQKKACKGERERYRKLVQRTMDRIKADPFTCDLALIEAQLPNYLASNARLRRKFMSRMERTLDEHQQMLEQQQRLEPNPGPSPQLTMTYLQSGEQSEVSASPARNIKLVTL